MAVKVFLTGATGYIGGTALTYIYKAYPDYDYTLLVRDESRAKPILAQHPNVKFVYGSLDDSALIEKAAEEADVVVHTADSSDNVSGATAVAKGLAAGHSASKPGYWIHLSGTGILTWYDAVNQRSGEPPLPEQKYNDIETIDRLVTLPDEAHHRNVDKIVQASISDVVKVAIVCPPCIYGTGSGAVNTRSIQVPDMARGTLQKGYAPIVGAGKTEWDNVHVNDLGDLYAKLVGATQDPSKKDNPEIFGLHGYFFAENGVHTWADVARQIADEASKQGYMPEAVSKCISQKEADLMDGAATPSYGYNSKGVAERARKYLGWEAKGRSMRDEVPAIVTKEAKALGLTSK